MSNPPGSKQNQVGRWFKNLLPASRSSSSSKHMPSSTGAIVRQDEATKAPIESPTVREVGSTEIVSTGPDAPHTTSAITPKTPDPTHAAKSAIRRGDSGQGLENFTLFLEVLKGVAEASELLGPMKVVCGVLLVVTKMAQKVQKNRGDLEELGGRLEEQSEALHRQTALFGTCRSVKDDASYGFLVISLEKYAEALREIKERLDMLDTEYLRSEVLKRAFEAKITEEGIKACTQQLSDAFNRYKTSIVEFTVLQTLSVNGQIKEITKRLDDLRLLQLPYAKARGNQHELCLEGTRLQAIEQLQECVRDLCTPIKRTSSWGVRTGAPY